MVNELVRSNSPSGKAFIQQIEENQRGMWDFSSRMVREFVWPERWSLPQFAVVATKEGDLLLLSGVTHLKVVASQVVDRLPVVIDGNDGKVHQFGLWL